MALKYPKDMGTEWMQLKQDVKSAFTSANSRSAFSKIGAGVVTIASSLLISAGAFFRFVWSTGGTGMILGRHKTGEGDDADGMLLFDTGGEVVFWSYNKVDDGTGFWAFFDKSGNIIFSADGESNKGLARPWIPLTWADTSELVAPPSGRQATGTTDTAVQTIYIGIQHPKIQVTGYVYTASGGATAEVKLKDLTTGDTIGSATQVSGFLQFEAVMTDYTFGHYHQFDITVRRASGSGNVGWTTLSVMGSQS